MAATPSGRHARAQGGRALAPIFTALIWLTVAAPAVPGAAAVHDGVPLPRRGTVYFGTYSPPSGSWSREAQQREYLLLEASLGRTLDIGHYYYGWRETFPTWREPWHIRSGRIPMISWSGYDTGAIVSGSQDVVIRARADAIRALGAPVFLRWLWEMDGRAVTLVRSPRSFKRAWRHIHDIFHARGATNASFVWCPTAWGFVTGEAQEYYPGNPYVDWVCADAYNWAPGRPGAEWRQLAQAIEPFYAWGLTTGKPLMLGEWGCQERRWGEKAAWFRQAADDLRARFPGIRAVVYFDTEAVYDWRVDTSSSASSAFRDMARDPYFSP